MQKRRRKQPLTLLEIMIVIFLIGLIGSVIGVNMKGSIDEGRYFKTEKSAEQIREILLLEVAKGSPIEKVAKYPEDYLKKSKIAKDPSKLLKDGWGVTFVVTQDGDDNIKVYSEKADKYRKAKKQLTSALEKDDETPDQE